MQILDKRPVLQSLLSKVSPVDDWNVITHYAVQPLFKIPIVPSKKAFKIHTPVNWTLINQRQAQG